MKRQFLSIVAAAVAGLAFTALPAQAQPKAPEKVTLMLNWYLYSEHAPFFLGKERGFFSEEGLVPRDDDVREGQQALEGVVADDRARQVAAKIGYLTAVQQGSSDLALNFLGG